MDAYGSVAVVSRSEHMNETWSMGNYRDIAEELFLSDFRHVWGNSHRTFESPAALEVVRGYISRKRCRPRSEEEEFEPGGMAMVVRLSGVWGFYHPEPSYEQQEAVYLICNPHKYPDLSVFSQISPIHTSPRWPPQIKLLQSMLPFHQWQCLQNLAPRRNLILSILEVCRVWILLVDSNSPERSMQALLQQ